MLGEDDYTRRLHFHVERIKNQQVISLPNQDAGLSFINSDEAARFLYWVENQTLEGPINACSKGELSLREVINLIEEEVNEKAIVQKETDEDHLSPFGVTDSLYMDTTKAEQAGFEFQVVTDWLPKLVSRIHSSMTAF